ncbi:hypothetical protein PFISCL1PPCAC_26804, partial [Pristionchus fissidentatus]
HYDGNAFGRFDSRSGRRLATMVPIKRGVSLVDNVAFSETDLRKLKALGKCDQKSNSRDSKCGDSSTICEKVASRGLCRDPAYFGLLKDDCKKSCGWCPKNDSSLIDLTCTNTLPNCPALAKSGFCNNPFYKEFKEKCSKSCGLC